MYGEYGLGANSRETDTYNIFEVKHDGIFGVSYGIENISEHSLAIKVDMTNSYDAYFTPYQGVVELGKCVSLHILFL